jgi:Mycobacterium membrane protein
VTLPWSKEFTVGQGFQPLVVNAQNAESGSISCRILIDGKVVNEHTSNGQYAVLMCSGS